MLAVAYSAFAACPAKSDKAACQALCGGKETLAVFTKQADDQGFRRSCICVSQPPASLPLWTGVFCRMPGQRTGKYTKSNCQKAAACESPATIESRCCATKRDTDMCKDRYTIPFHLCFEQGLGKPACSGAVTTTPTAAVTCAAYGCGKFVAGQTCQCDKLCTRKNDCCSDYSEICTTPTTIETTSTTTWRGSAKCGADEVARARLASDGSVADPCTKYHWLQAPDGGYTKPPAKMSEVHPFQFTHNLLHLGKRRPTAANRCLKRHDYFAVQC